MKKNSILLFSLLLLFSTSCKVFQKASISQDDDKIEIVFVHVNDIYEIAPLNGGKEGGMARVATLKKTHKAENPNTFLIMAGDFVSPSVYNGLKYEDKSIRGKQMVESMNAAGVDFAVFGNHEFDIKEDELQDRIDESQFKWISSNTFHKTDKGIRAFRKRSKQSESLFPQTYILKVEDKDGTKAKIGIIGPTLPFNQADYVSYTDPVSTSIELYNRFKDSVDIIIAISHLDIEDDIRLAKAIPELGLIMGGHEHDMQFKKEGEVYITKAHANAKSAYVINMALDQKNGKVQVMPKLNYINETIPFDEATNEVVQKWVQIADDNYSLSGFNASEVILTSSAPLEGRESVIRVQPTNLTEMVICAVQKVAPQADVVIVNSGAIRVDDILQAPISQYDILRAMPFGGGIREVEMKGNLLSKILLAGQKNSGAGGYLLYNDNIIYEDAVYKINSLAIDDDRTYRVAMLDFLLSGKEMNLEFLNENNPSITKIYPIETSITNPLSDIRLAVVKYLKNIK